MTDSTHTITRDSDDWPQGAPRWATCADLEAGGGLRFTRGWTIPSTHRGAEPLIVVCVEQEWTPSAGGYVVEAPRVAAGAGALWADWRAVDVAAALREIADALDPQTEGASLPAMEEGEDG